MLRRTGDISSVAGANVSLCFKMLWFILCCTCPLSVSASNVDTTYALRFTGSANSYFGYSVSFLENSKGFWTVVGAPKSNSTELPTVNQPGEIFKCNTASQGSCSRLGFNVKDNAGGERKDNGWLGVSLDTQTKQELVIACAHHTKNLDYNLQGVCYTIDAEFNSNTQTTITKESLSSKRDEFIGSSACFVKDSKSVLLGLLHSRYPTGRAAVYDSKTIATTQIQAKFSYTGYAVTSGNFYGTNKGQIVVGAPRGDETGQIFIYNLEMRSFGTPILSEFYRQRGEQMGEYFGAALCAVDLDGDKLDDLLVGAPLHSTDFEEGKVQILMNKGFRSFAPLMDGLTGSNTPRAQFGSSIAVVGDLNMDGYLDFAVGAPYENGRGAVYLYQGRPLPSGPRFQQRIAASPTSRGFGVSIARGMDIDGNNIPDIAVGAYLSDEVFVYRSRPLVGLTGKLTPSTHLIDISGQQCSFSGQTTSCFFITADITWVGKFVKDFDIEMTLMVDSLKRPEDSRVLIKTSDTDRNQTMTQIVNLAEGQRFQPFNYEVHIPTTPNDYITPINLKLEYKLKDKSLALSEFCATCPVADATKPSQTNVEVLFKKQCGADEKCDTDLQVAASFPDYSTTEVLIIGTTQQLAFSAEMYNNAEAAYGAMLLVEVPKEVSVQQKPPFCEFLPSISSVLRCNMANPLKNGEKVYLDLNFNLEKLPPKEGNITINVTAISQSNEVSNLEDNTALVQLLVKPMADIFVLGSTEDGQIFYNANDMSNTSALYNVTIWFEVSNDGPSAVEKANLTLYYPAESHNGGMQLTQIEAIKVLNDPNGEAFGSCFTPSRIQQRIAIQDKSIAVEDAASNATLLNCDKAVCHSAQCLVRNLRRGARLRVEVTISANTTSIREILQEQHHDKGIIFFQALITQANDNQPDNHKPDFATVTVEVRTEGPPPKGPVPVWAIVLGAVGGALLFALLTLILVKVGFFNRPIKEKLITEKRKTLTQSNQLNISLNEEEIS